MTDEKFPTSDAENKPACDQKISRKDFLAAVVKRATLAGALLIAPQVVDKFLVPPVYALNSTSHFHDTTPHTDTSPLHDAGTGISDNTSPLHDSGVTSPLHDSGSSTSPVLDSGSRTSPLYDSNRSPNARPGLRPTRGGARPNTRNNDNQGDDDDWG